MGFEDYLPVQEIALASKELPPEFVVSEEVQTTLHHRPNVVSKEDALQLPVIDLRPLLDITADEGIAAKVKEEIGRACEEWGFFQVIHHGIPESLLEERLEVVEGFFNLPLEEKMVYAMKPAQNQGYGKIYETQDTAME